MREFGVFLVASSAVEAGSVAERIRRAIRGAEFRPEGSGSEPLSVSVGGVSFHSVVTFDELFHLADQRLYEAKRGGRNRVTMAALESSAA